MNIKEIIEAERWSAAIIDNGRLSPFDWRHLHNFSLERIEAKLAQHTGEQYIDDLESELAEEARLNSMGAEREAQLLTRIDELDLRLGCCRDASTGKDLLIAELEAQMPKEVKPDRKQHNSFCACGCFVGYSDRYCCQCGAKLKWEKV